MKVIQNQGDWNKETLQQSMETLKLRDGKYPSNRCSWSACQNWNLIALHDATTCGGWIEWTGSRGGVASVSVPLSHSPFLSSKEDDPIWSKSKASIPLHWSKKFLKMKADPPAEAKFNQNDGRPWPAGHKTYTAQCWKFPEWNRMCETHSGTNWTDIQKASGLAQQLCKRKPHAWTTFPYAFLQGGAIHCMDGWLFSVAASCMLRTAWRRSLGMIVTS